jgi:hypothetical protein
MKGRYLKNAYKAAEPTLDPQYIDNNSVAGDTSHRAICNGKFFV